MSKKHFIALADVVRAMQRYTPAITEAEHTDFDKGFVDGQQKHMAMVVAMLADFCQSQNGNFMRDRWIGYINGENGKNGGRIGR